MIHHYKNDNNNEAPGHGKEIQDNLVRICNSFNKAVYMTGSKVGRLMTMFLAAVDLETGELYYINAGPQSPSITARR